MISGNISKTQDLIDVINGCLNNKVGILDLFGKKTSLSLSIENGNVVGFFSKDIEDIKDANLNYESLLIFHMVEFLDSSFGFFSFNEDSSHREFIKLNKPMYVEELILQTQLASVEFKSLLEKVITPFAVLKAEKGFQDMELYDGKSVYEVIATSKNSFVETIRSVKTLVSQGLLDISKFHEPFHEFGTTNVSVLIENVEATRIKLTSIMESLTLSRFSGFLKMTSQEPAFLYYINGKPIALYPINYPLFDFY